MMEGRIIPNMQENEVNNHFSIATSSIRNRSTSILHKKGDYLNKAINYVLFDSYMHPHLHPGEEKIEKMYLIEGSFALILFNDKGDIDETITLEKGKREFVEVPAFTWHTYVMLAHKVIIYETMEGVYDPCSWKRMAPWAPIEDSHEAKSYLQMLKKYAKK